MKKAKIYVPSKSAMQSGRGKNKNWVLEFETRDTTISPLMGWESSNDTMHEVRLEFPSKEKAEDYYWENFGNLDELKDYTREDQDEIVSITKEEN